MKSDKFFKESPVKDDVRDNTIATLDNSLSLANDTIKLAEMTMNKIDEQDNILHALKTKQMKKIEKNLNKTDKSLQNMQDQCTCTLF